MSTDTPIRDQLAKIEKLPTNEAQIGLVAEHGDVGAQGSVSVDVGKPGGWSVAAAGQWLKQKGYTVAALVGWKR